MSAEEHVQCFRMPALAESVAQARRHAEAAAQASGVSDVTAVVLAVSEAVSNAVLHAYSNGSPRGEIELALTRHSRGDFVVTVTDFGNGLKPRADSPGAGLGLPLIRKLTKELSVTDPLGGGTRVTMSFLIE